MLEQLLAKHRDHYQNHESEASALESNGLWQTPEGVDLVELASWTNVARAVLNLHETITRN